MKITSRFGCLSVLLALLFCFSACDSTLPLPLPSASSENTENPPLPVVSSSNEAFSSLDEAPNKETGKAYYCFSNEDTRYDAEALTSVVIDQDGKEIMRYTGQPSRPGKNSITYLKPAERLYLVYNAVTHEPSYISLHTDKMDSLFDLQGNLLLCETSSDEGEERSGYRKCLGDWVQRDSGGISEIVNVKTKDKITASVNATSNESVWFEDVEAGWDGMLNGRTTGKTPHYIAIASDGTSPGIMDSAGNLVPDTEGWGSFEEIPYTDGTWYLVSENNEYRILNTDFHMIYSSDFPIQHLQNSLFLVSGQLLEKVVALPSGKVVFESENPISYFDGELAILELGDGSDALLNVETGNYLYFSPGSNCSIEPSNSLLSLKTETFCVTTYPSFITLDRNGKTLWENTIRSVFRLDNGLWQEAHLLDENTAEESPDSKIGLLDAAGNYVIPPAICKEYSYYGNLYLFAYRYNGSADIYDYTGNLVSSGHRLGRVAFGDSQRLLWYFRTPREGDYDITGALPSSPEFGGTGSPSSKQEFTMTDLEGNIIYQLIDE